VQFLEAERPLAWGRDDRGAIWFAATRSLGIRFEAAEVGEPISAWCDVLEMEVESLLEDLLRDFELSVEGTAGEPFVIHARPRPERPHPRLLSATLELEPESKILKRVQLHKRIRGGGTAHVSFTHVESRPLIDSLYRLEGQLAEDAQIFSRDNLPERRRLVLFGIFGRFRAPRDPSDADARPQ
jgi:hypothetical protein